MTILKGNNGINDIQSNQKHTADFDVMLIQPIHIGGNKIARSFPKYDLRTNNNQLGSKDYPNFLYIRTQSGNIYQVFQSPSEQLEKVVQDFAMNNHKGGSVVNGNGQNAYPLPNGYFLFNPKTNTFSQTNNPLLEVGKPYIFTPGTNNSGNTTEISEIIGVSGSMSNRNNIKAHSNIETEFRKLSANKLNTPFTVILL